MNRKKKNASGWLLAWLLSCTSTQTIAQDYSIISESSFGDLKENIMRYTGNAVFKNSNNSITGDEISAKRANDGSMSLINILGKPAMLRRNETNKKQRTDLAANRIRYDMKSREVYASSNVHLVQMINRLEQQDRKLDIRGNTLTLRQSDKATLRVNGSPLNVIITQGNDAPITASAKELYYDEATQQLELEGGVVLTRLKETMKAEQLRYNLNTGILQVPKIPNKRVQINRSGNR